MMGPNLKATLTFLAAVAVFAGVAAIVASSFVVVQPAEMKRPDWPLYIPPTPSPVPCSLEQQIARLEAMGCKRVPDKPDYPWENREIDACTGKLEPREWEKPDSKGRVLHMWECPRRGVGQRNAFTWEPVQ